VFYRFMFFIVCIITISRKCGYLAFFFISFYKIPRHYFKYLLVLPTHKLMSSDC